MKAVSLVGIILAVVSLGKCTAEFVSGNVDTISNLTALTSSILMNIDRQVTLTEDQVTADTVVNFIQGKEKEEEEEEEEEDEGRGGAAAAGMAFHNESEHLLRRKRRQVADVKVPTLTGHVTGNDDYQTDLCPRDQVMIDEECHQVLMQGPCEDEEVVLINPTTKQAFCGASLCPIDRVFVYSDQLCHDPLEYGVCPPGRQLYTSSFGTPVCSCPDGTYEEEDDLDEDVCEPVLGHNDCPYGQVFWFSNFKSPAACLPDPCHGLNLRRGPSDLPYLPAAYDGKCYKIGTQPYFCKSDEFFSISFEQLKGVCTTLEDAGYKILDSDSIYSSFSNTGTYRKTYKTQKNKLTPASTTLLRRPEVGEAVIYTEEDEEDVPSRLSIGQPAGPGHPRHPHPSNNEVDEELTPLQTHMNAYSPSYLTVGGRTVTFLDLLQGLPRPHSRQRRDALPYASPGNVFEPGLSACKAGASRDGNAKCRETVLPGRYPPSRAKRSVPPVPPHPACPTGTFRDITRRCTNSRTSIAASINARALG